MGKDSKITWTDHTWNPWQGCRKVGPGCQNCYMYREKRRFKQNPAKVVRSKPTTFNMPLKWRNPARVFSCSWSDFFIEEADQWREWAWEIIKQSPHLAFLLLTKRPENILNRLPPGWPWSNVWLGVSVENQETANNRIMQLLNIPAAGRFLSVEPMLGPVDISHTIAEVNGMFDLSGTPRVRAYQTVDWVICGGESGPKARPMFSRWAYDLKKQCQAARIPFFMKQMSAGGPIPADLIGQEVPGRLPILEDQEGRA